MARHVNAWDIESMMRWLVILLGACGTGSRDEPIPPTPPKPVVAGDAMPTVAVPAPLNDASVIGDSSISCTFEPGVVRRAVSERMLRLLNCFGAARGNRSSAEIGSRFDLELAVDASGKVTDVMVIAGAAPISQALVRCVRGELVSLHLPQPPCGTVAQVRYPLIVDWAAE